jgi:DnaJ-class molecular chaperone
MAMKDPYLILGISRRENFRGIREAYQELTKKYHPDRAGPDATDKFRAIQEAYENLSNPEKRTIYDHDLDQNEIIVQSRPEPITYASRASVEFRSPGPLSLLREFRSIYPSFEPLYERFVRNFTKKQIPKGERIEGLNVDLPLSPEESAQGGTIAVGVPVFFTCAQCYGTGRDWLFLCSNCAGRGITETEKPVYVRIPRMLPERSVIEVPLHGFGIHNLFLRLHTRISSWTR